MIVGEGYLRFEPRMQMPLSEVAKLTFPVVETAGQRFFELFAEKRGAEVVVEDGSLRLLGRVRVTAAVLVSTFVGYGAVRQAVDYARHDGRIAAGWINQQIRELFSLTSDAVHTQRRRTPEPTRLLRLFDSVASGELSPDDAAREAEELFRQRGESSQTIQRVIPNLRRELASVVVADTQRPKRTPARRYLSPSAALPGRRVTVYRDERGTLRVVEQ
jgi:hypothetical protein